MTKEQIYENAKKNSLTGEPTKKQKKLVIVNPKRFIATILIASTIAATAIGITVELIKDKVEVYNYVKENNYIVTDNTFRIGESGNKYYFYNSSLINKDMKESDLDFEKALYIVYMETNGHEDTMDNICRFNGYENLDDCMSKLGYNSFNDFTKSVEKSILEEIEKLKEDSIEGKTI